MNTITITFPHPEVKQPKYSFNDRVAAKTNDGCQPEDWATGRVVGLELREYWFSPPTWLYMVKLDFAPIVPEEYSTDELVLEADIPTLQSEWGEES